MHHDENGLLIEPASPDQLRDAILDAARRPGAAPRLGERGREFAKDFTAEAMWRKYLALYESLLGPLDLTERARVRSMTTRIKALCITEDPDRPTTATFVGLKDAGVDVTVICPPGERRAWLEQNGVRVLDVPLRKQFDRDAVRRLRAELDARPLRHPALVQQQGAAERPRGEPRLAREDHRVSRNRRQRELLQPGVVAAILESAHRPHRLRRRCRPRFLPSDAAEVPADAAGAARDDLQRAQPRLVPRGAGGSDARSACPRESFAIVCVANYRPRKGIEVLVDAFGRAAAATASASAARSAAEWMRRGLRGESPRARRPIASTCSATAAMRRR